MKALPQDRLTPEAVLALEANQAFPVEEWEVETAILDAADQGRRGVLKEPLRHHSPKLVPAPVANGRTQHAPQ